MKKISAVLLVLVLVGSVAFASFTGSAEVNFGFDLDSTDYGFQNVVELTGDFVFFEKLAETAGSGDIYAEIKAELTLAFDFEEEPNETDVFNFIGGNVEITSAKIIGDDWHVGILGAMGAPNFASSAIDEDEEEDALDLDPSDYVAKGAGVEFGYAGYTLGISVPMYDPDDDTVVWNNLDAKDYYLFGSITTPDFDLADGMTLAFGAAGQLSNHAGNSASFSMKGAYEMDEMSASVAADLVYDGGVEFEVAVNAVVDIVTLDVYFATLDDSVATTDSTVDAYADGNVNILSAKAAFSIDQFDIAITGKDLLNASIIGASVDFAATEEISVNVNGGYTLMGAGEGDWYAGAGLTYTVDDYTAKLSGKFKSGDIIEMAASVESTTLVPGATLKLAWVDAKDLLKTGADGVEELGKIVASANIAF